MYTLFHLLNTNNRDTEPNVIVCTLVYTYCIFSLKDVICNNSCVQGLWFMLCQTQPTALWSWDLRGFILFVYYYHSFSNIEFKKKDYNKKKLWIRASELLLLVTEYPIVFYGNNVRIYLQNKSWDLNCNEAEGKMKGGMEPG